MESTLHAVPAWFWGLVVFVFGACWGSFLNVCIWRMPREQSVITPGSHCGNCHTPIPWYHNLPLISFFVLGGKCHQCGARFSFRYWLVEFLNAALWLLVWWRLEPERGWLAVIAYCVLVSMLIIGTFVDFEFYIIPDRITLGLVAVGFVFSAIAPALHYTTSRWQGLEQSILGIVAGGASLWVIVELGKLVFGRLDLRLPRSMSIEIADQKIKLGEAELHWDEIFFQEGDRVRFRAVRLMLHDQAIENVDVVVSRKAIQIGSKTYELDQAGRIEATLDVLILPEKPGEATSGFLSRIRCLWRQTRRRCRRLFGKEGFILPLGGTIVIESGRLRYAYNEIPFEELFFRQQDRIEFHAERLSFQDREMEGVAVRIREDQIEFGEQKLPLADVGKVVAITDRIVIPREAMGFGDVKLMAGIGAFVGWRPIFLIVMVSALVGSVVGIALVLLGQRHLQGRIPYGPYIALAALIWLFAGPDILNWYWGLTEPKY